MGGTFFPADKEKRCGEVFPDFRNLNSQIKYKPYPMPKIQEMLTKLEGFKYSTTLDLNMGYYNIILMAYARCIRTIIIPWGKYKYKSLPMGGHFQG